MKAKEVPWRKAAPAPITLIFGPQDYFAMRAVRSIRQQLVAKLGNIEVERVSAAAYVAGQLNSLVAPSLFAEPKCIIMEGLEKCSDDLISDGIDYLAKPDPDVTLILLHDGSSVRGKKLLDAIRANSGAVEIPVPKPKNGEGEAFVLAEFQTAGRPIQQQAVRALADAFGANYSELASACEQLMQDAEANITEELVDKYYGGRIEVSIFKIMDSALAGHKAQALEYLRHALSGGADRVQLVGSIATQMRLMIKLVRGGSAATLGANDYAVKKARAFVQSWNEEGLANVVNEIAAADAAAKGASRDPDFVLEQLILLITNKGKR